MGTSTKDLERVSLQHVDWGKIAFVLSFLQEKKERTSARDANVSQTTLMCWRDDKQQKKKKRKEKKREITLSNVKCFPFRLDLRRHIDFVFPDCLKGKRNTCSLWLSEDKIPALALATGESRCHPSIPTLSLSSCLVGMCAWLIALVRSGQT